MKNLLTLLAIALLLSSCQTKSYHCVSIDVTYPDTIDIEANSEALSRYEGDSVSKVGDTVLVWHTGFKTGSNYVVKSIK